MVDIEDRFELSVPGLFGYVISDHNLYKNFSDEVVLITGISKYISNVDRTIFVVFDLHEALNSVVTVVKVPSDVTCDLCGESIDRKTKHIYSTEQSDIKKAVSKQNYNQTLRSSVTVCPNCQGAMETDIQENISNNIKLALTI